MGKKSRVVWTTRERAEVVKFAVKLMRSYPKMPMFRAVGEAQEHVLPVPRRRAIINKATLGDLVDDMNRELNRPVEHMIETGKFETVAEVSDDAISVAVRSVAEKFEAQLRAAISNSTARIIKEAAEGRL
jgi:hypothetical protein